MQKSEKLVGDAISTRLRQYYDSVKDEPIPDRFLDLLEKLDEVDRSQSPKASHGRQGADSNEQ